MAPVDGLKGATDGNGVTHQLLPHWGESRRGTVAVETASSPEQVWLLVKELKGLGNGMEGFHETPQFMNKKGVGNRVATLATARRMKGVTK